MALQAQTLAQSPYRKPPVVDARRAALDYDAVRRIQFRQPQALWRGSGSPFEMHFFPVAGEHVVRALRLHEVTDGNARPLKLAGLDLRQRRRAAARPAEQPPRWSPAGSSPTR